MLTAPELSEPQSFLSLTCVQGAPIFWKFLSTSSLPLPVQLQPPRPRSSQNLCKAFPATLTQSDGIRKWRFTVIVNVTVVILKRSVGLLPLPGIWQLWDPLIFHPFTRCPRWTIGFITAGVLPPEHLSPALAPAPQLAGRRRSIHTGVTCFQLLLCSFVIHGTGTGPSDTAWDNPASQGRKCP